MLQQLFLNLSCVNNPTRRVQARRVRLGLGQHNLAFGFTGKQPACTGGHILSLVMQTITECPAAHISLILSFPCWLVPNRCHVVDAIVG